MDSHEVPGKPFVVCVHFQGNFVAGFIGVKLPLKKKRTLGVPGGRKLDALKILW